MTIYERFPILKNKSKFSQYKALINICTKSKSFKNKLDLITMPYAVKESSNYFCGRRKEMFTSLEFLDIVGQIGFHFKQYLKCAFYITENDFDDTFITLMSIFHVKQCTYYIILTLKDGSI